MAASKLKALQNYTRFTRELLRDRKQATAIHEVHVKQRQGETYLTVQMREQNPPAGTSTIDVTLIAVDTESDWFTDGGEKRSSNIGGMLIAPSSYCASVCFA